MKKIPLVVKILIGFVLGTALGLVLSECCAPETAKKVIPYLAPFGDVLVAMLKMVVYPIILFSLIVGAASLPLKSSGKVGLSVIVWYTLTSCFATVFGVAMAYLLNPSMEHAAEAASGNLASVAAMSGNGAGVSISAFIVGLFQNPFAALAQGQFLPIIIFAIFFGICARWIIDRGNETPEVTQAVKVAIHICEGFQHVSFRMIQCVVAYFPYGVFALSAVNFAQNGTLLFGPYMKITICVAVCVLAMILVIYPLAIALFCHENPYKALAKFRQPILTAFVTRSSAATLPISFMAADEAGIDRKLSSFSLPMGATVNMDGVCVHLPVFVILAANMFGHHLTCVQIATLCLSIMFASIGTGGIPGGSVFLLFMVLESMGLPANEVTMVVALCLGINPILDMFETCCNVAGDNVCTYIVAKRNGLITTPSANR